MKVRILNILLVVLTFFSCDSSTGDSTANSNENEKKSKIEKQHTILIVGDDRSGSTSKNRKLTIEDYSSVLKHFTKYNFGTIAIRAIGNPVNESLEFFRMELIPENELIPINEDADPTLSERKAIVKKNKAIKAQNDSINKVNDDAIDFFLDTINSNIINYKKNGKDLTDINDFLNHLNELCSEISSNEYTTIKIVIFSDGVHDANKSKVVKIAFKENVELHLIGWKDKNCFDLDEQSIHAYESKEGFLTSFKNKK